MMPYNASDIVGLYNAPISLPPSDNAWWVGTVGNETAQGNITGVIYTHSQVYGMDWVILILIAMLMIQCVILAIQIWQVHTYTWGGEKRI